MFGIEDVFSFFEGFAASNTGALILNTVNENNIARIDLEDNYEGRITMANGDKYDISNVETDSYGKILSFYLKKTDVSLKTESRQVTCSYDENGYLTSVGTVEITGMQELNLNVNLNLQTKTVSAGYSQVTVSADTGYDGLETVYVNAIPNGNVMQF